MTGAYPMLAYTAYEIQCRTNAVSFTILVTTIMVKDHWRRMSPHDGSVDTFRDGSPPFFLHHVTKIIGHSCNEEIWKIKEKCWMKGYWEFYFAVKEVDDRTGRDISLLYDKCKKQAKQRHDNAITLDSRKRCENLMTDELPAARPPPHAAMLTTRFISFIPLSSIFDILGTAENLSFRKSLFSK